MENILLNCYYIVSTYQTFISEGSPSILTMSILISSDVRLTTVFLEEKENVFSNARDRSLCNRRKLNVKRLGQDCQIGNKIVSSLSCIVGKFSNVLKAGSCEMSKAIDDFKT